MGSAAASPASSTPTARRGARQLSPRRNSADRLLLSGGGHLHETAALAAVDGGMRYTQLETSDVEEGEMFEAEAAPPDDEPCALTVGVGPAATLPKKRGPPPVPAAALPKAPDEELGALAMNGSLERAVRVLGGDAPPLDDAVAELMEAREQELAAADQLAALASEITGILTPVKPRADLGDPDRVRPPVWFDGAMSRCCGSAWVGVPLTALLLVGGAGFCYPFWLKARCADSAQGGALPAVAACVGGAVFWACMISAGWTNRKLSAPGGPLKRLCPPGTRLATARLASLRRIALLYVVVGLVIGLWFVALAIGLAALLLPDSAATRLSPALTASVAEMFPPEAGCAEAGVFAEDVRRAYWLGLVSAAAGCVLVWQHMVLAISALLAAALGADAIRDIRRHTILGAPDVAHHRQLSSQEKQDWRDAIGAVRATGFDAEKWEEEIVQPVLRLTRSTLPALSTWGAALGFTMAGAWALVLGAIPLALATTRINLLLVSLPAVSVLIPLLKAAPMVYVSSECDGLRVALNHLRLEGKGANSERVRCLLDYLGDLNLGQGPGVVVCGGVVLRKRWFAGALALLAGAACALAAWLPPPAGPPGGAGSGVS